MRLCRPALACALLLCTPGASAQESVPCWYDAANDMIRTCADNLEVPASGCTNGEGLTERCSDRASCECPATLTIVPGVTVSVTVRSSGDQAALTSPGLALGLLGMLGAANLRPLALVAVLGAAPSVVSAAGDEDCTALSADEDCRQCLLDLSKFAAGGPSSIAGGACAIRADRLESRLDADAACPGGMQEVVDTAFRACDGLTGLDGTERSSWETAKAVFVAAAEDCGCSGAARGGPGLLVLLLAAVAAGWQG